ncbi:hypothetical protein [Radiobacillus deserti]|uniref:DUF892 family protein n=1 Tax=Radiobacillus deserti TaxID=2594883 RepID=A0A516KKE3_9BACI|nr:hypothetical protein [Radiobacillus deserti]QDP41873.1 hypothetical protein FN924_17860 [Radiobacillus deserti]
MTQKQSLTLIELGSTYREEQLDRVERWLGNTIAIQIALMDITNKALKEIKEPHIHEALSKMEKSNQRHQDHAESLYKIISKEYTKQRNQLMGKGTALLEQGLFSFQDLMGGAVGSWKYMHQLVSLNQQVMGAFAILEQLGLALGMKDFVDTVFKIVHEKQMHQLMLQEYMLEMASISILYKNTV